MLKINCELVTSMLIRFLKDETGKIGLNKAVLGLSGGVDSAVVAALLARAFNPNDVTALIMPYRESNPDSRVHAELLAKKLKINYLVQDISVMVDTFFADKPKVSALRKGNKMARERMCLLYDYSAEHAALVIGTSNKTELLLGYGTIFGDLASAINPIGDLYKSQIWQLAEYLDIPKEIIDKPPSADLWIGQTDEDELGYTYEEIDKLLYHVIDLRYPEELLLDLGYTTKTINDIKSKIQKSQFKRRPPVIAKLTNRTINQDFRYCRDWGA
ncbi:MAG TPA: NAD+ synthase [Caldithrix sp.]|nr:NAD+ synthase [Caldithrix sp.]